MKVRIKYTKTGPMRFISHLDVMRYFQKALRRAEFDVRYTQGFSPHQILSFAAPMPLGLTSEGEYFDGEFNSVTTTFDMVETFNQTASPYLKITDIVILPDNAGNAMSVVTASDYIITLNEEGNQHITTEKLEAGVHFLAEQQEIMVMRKTKKKEVLTDIRPMILKAKYSDNRIYLFLTAGSVNHLKPELFLEVLCENMDIPYNRWDYNIHRLETYMDDGSGNRVPLIEAGRRF